MTRVHWDPAHVQAVSVATEPDMDEPRPLSRAELFGIIAGAVLAVVCVGLLIIAVIV